MEPSDRKPASPASRVLDAGLTLAVFAFLTWLLAPHVPSNDPFYIWLWGAIGASCLTGVFWLCLQMFRAVLRAQLASRKK